ncbi:MAG: hypothetical protein K2L29_01340, partial [Duncaniella sp.]|nr:hypothetical protein [Duncaniella sp.]
MKKIFTFLAVAAMAITAQAQTWGVTEGFVAEDNKTVSEVADCPITFSPDGKWAAFKVDQFGTADEYPTLGHSIQGGNNPKANGNGYKKGDNTSFPDQGCGYIFSPAKDGNLDIYVKLAGGKPSFVITDKGTFANWKAIKADTKKACGEIECSANPDVMGIDGDGQCVVSLPVEAGTKYCIVTDGSKATLYGYTFTAGGSSAIENITVDANAPVEYFNLQGLRVNNPENGLY